MGSSLRPPPTERGPWETSGEEKYEESSFFRKRKKTPENKKNSPPPPPESTPSAPSPHFLLEERTLRPARLFQNSTILFYFINGAFILALDKLPRYISFIIDHENQKTKKSLTSLTGKQKQHQNNLLSTLSAPGLYSSRTKKRSNAKGGATRPRDVVNTPLFLPRKERKKKKKTAGILRPRPVWLRARSARLPAPAALPRRPSPPRGRRRAALGRALPGRAPRAAGAAHLGRVWLPLGKLFRNRWGAGLARTPDGPSAGLLQLTRLGHPRVRGRFRPRFRALKRARGRHHQLLPPLFAAQGSGRAPGTDPPRPLAQIRSREPGIRCGAWEEEVSAATRGKKNAPIPLLSSTNHTPALAGSRCAAPSFPPSLPPSLRLIHVTRPSLFGEGRLCGPPARGTDQRRGELFSGERESTTLKKQFRRRHAS